MSGSSGMERPFVHLRVHSDYSFLEGVSNPQSLADAARKHEQPAMALTDTLALYGALTLSKVATGLGVQPIIGTKIFVRTEHTTGSLILLAKNEKGYIAICETLRMCLEAEDGKAGFLTEESRKVLTDRADGIILIAGVGADSLFSKLLDSKHTLPEVEAVMSSFTKSFAGNAYFEICRDGKYDEAAMATEKAGLAMASKFGWPIVATSPVHYATPDQFDSHEIVQAVRSEAKASLVVSLEGISVPEKILRHLRSSEEMRALFHDLPAAYDNTLEIARRCAFKVSGRKPFLPPFESLAEADKGKTEAELLREKSHAGLERRLRSGKKLFASEDEYRKRLDYELGIIERMEFPGYFLIVNDFIEWSLANDIPVGLGRGSGAGSLVAYALNITGLDPLQFGLLFERFLNPERVSMPDFDIDFCTDGRKDVIDYVRNRYGPEKVGQIVTFLKIKSKSAVRDAARVLHPDDGPFGQGEINSFCNLIPPDPDTPADPAKLALAYNIADDLKRRVDTEERGRILFENAKKIEGALRGNSSHAAGVVIGDKPLTEILPVGYDKNTGHPVVQFNMKDAEAVGLVKFDFLGLETLTIIKRALRFIRMTHPDEPPLDLDQIPLDDKPTMRLFQEGRTDSVFQFESEGMKKAIKDVRPTQIEDLIAICALFRPGPMDNIPLFAQRKRGEVETIYPEPADKTKLFLAETYGIMVYQEQVMLVAQVVAGYSLGGADLLRRAMGKKIRAEMELQRAQFVEGAVKNGTSDKKAGELFDTIAKFADYGFNKSHAAAYGVIGYRTAYLKAHYPAEFFAAVLTSEKNKQDKDEKIEKLSKEMAASGILLLPPDVNKSGAEFVPELVEGKFAVRYALTAIKGIANVESFLAERDARGPFRKIVDFHSRVGMHFNSNNIENLANCGAFSSLDDGSNRRVCLEALKHLSKGKKTNSTQTALFGDDMPVAIPPDILKMKDWGRTEIAEKEKLAVGFYFDSHPLDIYIEGLKRIKGIRSLQSIIDFVETKDYPAFSGVASFGIVSKVMSGHNKFSGKKKVDIVITDKTGTHTVGLAYKAFHRSSVEDVTRELIGLQGKPIIFQVEISRGNNGRFYINTPHFRALESYMAARTIETVGATPNAVARFIFDPGAVIMGKISMTELPDARKIRESYTTVIEQEKNPEYADFHDQVMADAKIFALEPLEALLKVKIKETLARCRSRSETASRIEIVFAYSGRKEWFFNKAVMADNYAIDTQAMDELRSLGCRDDFPQELLSKIDGSGSRTDLKAA
jgi:DNA polymerase-3 subunit alpha